MTTIIIVVIIIMSVVLIVAGIYAFFKRRAGRSRGTNRIQLDSILTIETDGGSVFLIALGVVLLVAALVLSKAEKTIEIKESQLTKAQHTIQSQESQLESVVPSGTAMALVPFQQFENREDIPVSEDRIDQFKKVQESTYDEFMKHVDDETFTLLVLKGFEKNSFGLATIPTERIKDFNEILLKAKTNFPANAEVQVEIAKAYRWLYESPALEPEEKNRYLSHWEDSINSVNALQITKDETKLGAALVTGLYYQEKAQNAKDPGGSSPQDVL